MDNLHEYPEGGPYQEAAVLSRLRHYLPTQAPLKDFVHHNTLHAFQHLPFEEAVRQASAIFGYKVSLSVEEYRALYRKHRIREDVLEDRIIRREGEATADDWIHDLFHKQYDDSNPKRIGQLRGQWQEVYGIDLDVETHPRLFKLLNSYFDQGIASWKMPTAGGLSLLGSLQALEASSWASIFRGKRARRLLADPPSIQALLDLLVGDETLYEQYLFDQQFGHPGWSGMVATVERAPESLLDRREASLRDLVVLELLLELDALDSLLGGKWSPLGHVLRRRPEPLFAPVPRGEREEVRALWQEAFEWSFYDQVLAGIAKMKGMPSSKPHKTFQALFCIDDREGSIRRHIENIDPRCETYGTPGFFGLAFYYQPADGKFHTKLCPPPMSPKHILKERGASGQIHTDIHFSRHTHHPVWGTLLTLSLGFWSAVRLFVNIFRPSLSPAASYSFSQMQSDASLTVAHEGEFDEATGLPIGFTLPEMALNVEKVLRSIGLVDDFGELVYVIGHGASSINNTHYAGYDCGACSGRPGSVNARAFSQMANREDVRRLLGQRGIAVPEGTRFVGGMHDTTRDEFIFYDEDQLTVRHRALHALHLHTFGQALARNAKERSRRFFSIDSKRPAEEVLRQVRNRSVSLFEPRPELNHATNALCIVGRHSLHEGLFLDRRAFSNSYDCRLDPDGELLSTILNAATPVCGGINLEYYFSRVDNQKLGAGSKLPHNVMGLLGVGNGVEGDLRPGLPKQMVEVHDPLRLLMIVEHYPEAVLRAIRHTPATYEWYANEWMHLVAIHPDTFQPYVFSKGNFVPYNTLKHLLDTVYDVETLVESGEENLPVYLVKK